MASGDAQEYLSALSDLPTLPAMAVKVMEMAMDDRADSKAFAQLIGQDQSLAARVLRLANSPHFRGSKEIGDLHRAIVHLGMRAVRNLALSVMVFDVLGPRSEENSLEREQNHVSHRLDLVELWKHAAAVGLIAEDLARELGADHPDEAYMAGLLHDIGKVVISHAAPERMAEVLATLAENTTAAMIDVEDRVLGVNHCVIGRKLAERWGFPTRLIEAIWLHHQPIAGKTREELLSMPCLVRCANEIAHAHRLGDSGNDHIVPLLSRWQAAYGLTTEHLERLAQRALEKMRELLDVLGMQTDWPALYMALVRRANAEIAAHAHALAARNRVLEARQRILDGASKLAMLPDAATALSDLLLQLPRIVCEAFELPAATCLAVEPGQETISGLAYERATDSCRVFTIPIDTQALPDVRALGDEGVELSAMERLMLSDREVFRLAEGLVRGLQGSTLLAVPLAAGGARRGMLLVDSAEISDVLRGELPALCALLSLALDRFMRGRELEKQTEELARAARQVEEKELQLYHNERLSTVGRLAAGAAHEINNPLAIIMGNAQLLQRTDDEAKRRRLIDGIIEQAQRINKLVLDLMVFARPSKPDLAPVDVATMVENVFGMVGQRLSTALVEMSADIAPGLPNVFADQRQIEQVLVNLVINAVQAMPEGGKLTVRAALAPDREQIEIAVSDTGIGIPPENLKFVFDPFFTTKGDMQGLGLGLAVSHSIALRHHGTLAVESTVGKGTTFRLRLPAANAQQRTQKTAIRVLASAESRGDGKRVLIIDDEEKLRAVVRQFLSEEGYQVAEAADGKAALHQLAKQPFDVVLLDLRLPRADAISLLRGLCDTMPQLPVIVLTGLSSDEELAEVKQAGAYAVLSKPFHLSDLLRVVEEAVAWRARRMHKSNGAA